MATDDQPAAIRNPVFARLYARLARNEPEAVLEHRREMLAGLSGRVLEHVLSPRDGVARAQRVVDRVFWPRAFGNCHTARDTPAAIAAAGFVIGDHRRFWAPPCAIAVPVGEHVLGTAVRP